MNTVASLAQLLRAHPPLRQSLRFEAGVDQEITNDFPLPKLSSTLEQAKSLEHGMQPMNPAESCLQTHWLRVEGDEVPKSMIVTSDMVLWCLCSSRSVNAAGLWSNLGSPQG